MKLERVDRDRTIMRHDPNADAAPLRRCESQRLLKNIGIAGAVYDDIRLALENFLRSSAEVAMLRVDRMRSSELLRLFEFMIEQVHRDDGAGSGERGTKHRAEANAATTNDDDRFANADSGVVSDSAKTCRECIGQ